MRGTQTPALQNERKYLLLSCIGNILVGCVGISVAVASASQAILLEGLADLDRLRARTQAALSEAHLATIVDMRFTTDRRWGAPLADGGAGGATLGPQ